MEQSVYLLAIVLFTVNIMFQKAVSVMVARVEQSFLVKEQKSRVAGLLARVNKKFKERSFIKQINKVKQELRNIKWVDTS